MPGSCGIPYAPSSKPCVITAEVKNRSGHPRWWCQTHGCEAWGPSGVRLPSCAGAAVPAPRKVVQLDPADYAGGIALWGAVPPSYFWGFPAPPIGIHVHARHAAGGDKVIDETFEEVVVKTAKGPWRVTANMAQAYLVSSTLGLKMTALRCRCCQALHLDMFEFAVTSHRKHQCNSCGRSFFETGPGVSNPLVELQHLIQPIRVAPTPSRSVLRLRQRDISGLAVWGSNEAIIWTPPKSEMTGIHVHAINKDGVVTVDETFGRVVIDGQELSPDQTRLLMVQRTLPFLNGRVVSMTCQTCGAAHFDAGHGGVAPVIEHNCEACGAAFENRGRRQGAVSNPADELFRTLAMKPRGRRPRRAA